MRSGFFGAFGVVAAIVSLVVVVPMLFRLIAFVVRSIILLTPGDLCDVKMGRDHSTRCVRRTWHFGTHASKWMPHKTAGWYRVRFTDGYDNYTSWGEFATDGWLDKPAPPSADSAPVRVGSDET